MCEFYLLYPPSPQLYIDCRLTRLSHMAATYCKGAFSPGDLYLCYCVYTSIKSDDCNSQCFFTGYLNNSLLQNEY